jgi:hypothetical protein
MGEGDDALAMLAVSRNAIKQRLAAPAQLIKTP